MKNEYFEMLAEAEQIDEIVIMHDGVRRVYDEIFEVIKITEISHRKSKYPQAAGICLTGKAGTGKTTLSNILIKQFPKEVVIEQNLEVQTHPILFTSVQGKSINGLAIVMLGELGDHSAYKTNNQTLLTERLKVQLRTAKTNLIILDEFHELLTDSQNKNVVSWLKTLLNTTGIPVLVMGTPGVESLTESNNENLRRYKTLTLDKLDYIFDEPNCQFCTYTSSLIEAYKKKIELESFYKLEKATDYLRVYLATNGYPSNIAELFQNAAKAAFREGVRNININHLSAAFNDSKLIDLLVGNHNPFMMKNEDAFKLYNAPITSVGR